jgi:hypothetical protein
MNSPSRGAEGAELDASQPPTLGQFDPGLADADGQRHLLPTPGRLATLDAPNDGRLTVEGKLCRCSRDSGRKLGELAEPLRLSST